MKTYSQLKEETLKEANVADSLSTTGKNAGNAVRSFVEPLATKAGDFFDKNPKLLGSLAFAAVGAAGLAGLIGSNLNRDPRGDKTRAEISAERKSEKDEISRMSIRRMQSSLSDRLRSFTQRAGSLGTPKGPRVQAPPTKFT